MTRALPRASMANALTTAGEPADAAGPAPAGEPPCARVRRRLVVRGLVQGVGFRPFVYVTAAELGLGGSVINDGNGVVAEVEGAPGAVAEFERRLRQAPPPMALVEAVEAYALPAQGGTGFAIGDSDCAAHGQTLAAPDIATCADCRAELEDPRNRRYRHPFITCTNCGPRFTIITGLPYDRPRTTMASFEMCDRCRAEYTDPGDRRFHAQPISCHDCGPRLEYVEYRQGSDDLGVQSRPVGSVAPGRAVETARARLRDGAILAIKGIGGYHLVCDATNRRAVQTLRDRKRRGDKPFALMVADLASARAIAEVNAAEADLLISIARPIVLLRRRPGTNVAEAVAPATDQLGVMLPYSPLHALLFGLASDPSGPSVLVMTSGNLGGEPIAYDDADAVARLAPLADGWLRHDRPIHVPCDDSVLRVVDSQVVAIRRSRGLAPMPVALPFPVEPTLAVGGDLKNACAVAAGRYAWLSQHIGDMDDLATLDAFTRAELHLERLTGVVARVLAADTHPGYRSTRWARDHAEGRTVEIVQHHHAHVASVMAEHGLDRGAAVIGVAFDGTGYGSDGGIWGGEVLLADYLGFTRFAQLAYVPLAGGDASVQRPYRMALAHLHAAGIAWTDDLAPVRASPAAERRTLERQLRTGFGCVPTSSMGRLFDAIAALAGGRQTVGYEAQAAIEFEALATDDGQPAVDHGRQYAFAVRPGVSARFIADPAPVVRAVVRDVRAGGPIEVISGRFHRAVAELVVELAVRAYDQTDRRDVALTGGVFQNARLLSLSRNRLQDKGFRVLTNERVPPNDGGLALGQLVIAAARRTEEVTHVPGRTRSDR